MLRNERAVSIAETGLDGVALKPTECEIGRATALDAGIVTIDYEGREHFPETETLRTLAENGAKVRVTTPVRADGFDPLGNDRSAKDLPAGTKRVLVAGHAAYLTDEERRRRVAPRLRAALKANPGAWIGTEGIERTALAAGGTQFELLSGSTIRDVRSLRAAGFMGEVAVYAPTVLAGDENAILDAVGAYVARRRPVSRALPADAPADRRASGRAREVLIAASGDYALCGTSNDVREQVCGLKNAGVDLVIGYPARGIEEFLS